MTTHSFFPNQSRSMLFAMAGDDCSLYFDLDALTPKQQADHVSNVELTAMLQVAHLYIGKPTDHVAMFDEFQCSPWRELLAFYHDAFHRMGTHPIVAQNMHYYPSSDFYANVADNKPNTDLTTIYLVSGSNAPLHANEQALEISREINSKMVLARNAQEFGIPTPQTLVCTKASLGSQAASSFVREHGEVMLKIMGLAGARNVTSIRSIDEALAYLDEYEPEMEVVLQRKLDTQEFTEMTVDLIISDDDIRIANVRKILFADGLWVGNLIGGSVELTEAQRAVLINVGEYARSMGYVRPEGLNCGIDYFVSAQETLVTEINARWTGGLFPAEMSKRLGLGDTDVVAFFDTVTTASVDRYRDFLQAHLYPQPGSDFANVPIGFSPFPLQMNGEDVVFVWHMVVGDLDAFKSAKRAALGANDMPTAEVLSVVV